MSIQFNGLETPHLTNALRRFGGISQDYDDISKSVSGDICIFTCDWLFFAIKHDID